MSENPYFVKSGEPMTFPPHDVVLHSITRLPVSPMRLGVVARRQHDLLPLARSDGWRPTHVESHALMENCPPQLVPQTWRNQVGVLVISGKLEATTQARCSWQTSELTVGSLVRIPQQHARLPTRTLLNSLATETHFVLLGDHPALFC